MNSEVLPLTPALAQEFNNLTPSPTERELDASRLLHLRKKADDGLLVTFQWAKAQLEGQWLRMNGQHSSTMLCELDGGFPEGLFVHIDSYEVETKDDLAVLFRQFDDRKSSRTAKNVAGAYRGLEDDLREIDGDIAKLGIDAVAWYRRDILKIPGTPRQDEQYTLFHEVELHDYLKWLNELFSAKTPELRRKPVMAAMYATFDSNADGARAFWLEVARGGKEFEDNAASTVLDDWLKIKMEDRPVRLSAQDFYRGCIYAWNAHREDKLLREIKHDVRKAAQRISD